MLLLLPRILLHHCIAVLMRTPKHTRARARNPTGTVDAMSGKGSVELLP